MKLYFSYSQFLLLISLVLIHIMTFPADKVVRIYVPDKKILDSFIKEELASRLASHIKEFDNNTTPIRRNLLYTFIEDLMDQGASLANLSPHQRHEEDRLRNKLLRIATNDKEKQLALNLSQERQIDWGDYDFRLRKYYEKLDMQAAKYDIERAAKLIKWGVNVNVRKAFDETPLLYESLKKKRFDIAQTLMEYGADPDMTVSPKGKQTIRQAYPEIINKLEEKVGKKNKPGWCIVN